MGATADRAAADLPLDGQTTKSSSSSFFSRWALPLRSRTRNLADFHIRPDEPHRQFSAGDHVTGTIVLTLIKPVRITHLTVALHGYVRVFKNAGAAAQGMPINPAVTPNEGSRSLKYFGNGHASLFQDEQVLCGEGRLAARKWEFKFDLVFPSKGLPSSIDFERGSISYVVSATLTRPTSISPTTCAERKVTLMEKLDIGLLPTPRERNVTMHAMPKKPRRRRTTATATTPTTMHRSSFSTETPETVSDLDSTRAHENSNGGTGNGGDPIATTHEGLVTPRSPIPSDLQSEISGESAASTSSNPARGASGSVAGSKHSGMGAEDREITATVELLKGGCLPGDPLPVRIKISHNRRIKSMHGIIVTFYRQGRVDYAPPPSLFKDLSQEEIRRLEREEYYPKSKTGLGGLSLSSAGSCSVFRKDLSQSVAPLIIDPLTLTANITTSVRVPEDVFPSIRGVPGGLVSFKYYVEVVIDLGGRLSGQTQGSVPQPTRMGSVSGPAGAPVSSDHLSRLANWNGAIVDTDTIRREKGVIYVPIEVVIGTVDSTRSRGKSAIRPALTIQPPTGQESPYGTDHANYTWQGASDDDYYNETADFSTPFEHSQSYFPPHSTPQIPYNEYRNQDLQAPAYIPPPQLPRQDTMTDKERARQAEMRLLPSQPPDLSEAGPSQAGPSQPSAPGEDSQQNSHAPSQPDGTVVPSLPVPEDEQGPSVPTLDDLLPSESSHPNEDKQELERCRLLLEASAPPEVPDDFNGEPSAPPLAPTGLLNSHEPSAPALGEDDAYGSHDTYGNFGGPSTGSHSTGHEHGAEQLPKYER